MADQRIKDLETEFYRAGTDIEDLLERAFEYGLMEPSPDHTENRYRALGIDPIVARNNYIELIRTFIHDPKCQVFGPIWQYADIAMRCHEIGIPQHMMTDDVVDDIAHRLTKQHDAEIGINWDTIDYWCGVKKDELYAAKKEQKDGTIRRCNCGHSLSGDCDGSCTAPDPQGEEDYRDERSRLYGPGIVGGGDD